MAPKCNGAYEALNFAGQGSTPRGATVNGTLMGQKGHQMKKLLLTLIALASIIGCNNQVGTAEIEPEPIPRLTFSDDFHGSLSVCLYIITDNETGQEYMYSYTDNGVAICPMIKQEITAEKKE